MRASKWLLAAVPIFALMLAAEPPRARACGACLQGETENTQVTGHRMIFSISQTQTTLWDQISYTGDPSSFAWVLPVKGTAEIGLSSDALFGTLDQFTQVTVGPPPLDCPPPPDCYEDDFASGGAGGASGGVDVVAQAVVGPYETVTLHSSDPNALANWLSSHGYVIPADFAPVVSAYVNEGFDFVALKLVPGQGVSAMRPVRVTVPGAAVSLPLRMVAGGTGAQTPITLWILGEGRYQPSSSPAAVISEKDLVWDFATSSSNYAELRQDLYASGAWLVETSGRVQSSGIAGTINYLIQYPELGDSGYGDAMGNGAEEEAQADYDKLWGALGKTPWLTRVSANLPRASLADDLVLGASADQSEVRGYLTAAKGINPPPCPTYACDDASTPSGAGSSGCAVGSESERTATYGATIAALGLLLMRRRRPAPR